ncbi:hypothetical protein X777_02854 [Ooceraea biroi]|uniref:Uncharacterized protein n=1 Tax=Ooceraea biroi TaxID=2015173 RepID=A0A026WKP5_OOCBI|nr:hypothetical protein X777_02854 [Ooceraea biroi]
MSTIRQFQVDLSRVAYPLLFTSLSLKLARPFDASIHPRVHQAVSCVQRDAPNSEMSLPNASDRSVTPSCAGRKLKVHSDARVSCFDLDIRGSSSVPLPSLRVALSSYPAASTMRTRL